MERVVHLVQDRFPGRPGLDTGVSRALLSGVDTGRLPETFRLFVPDRIVAFGRQDTARAGYPAAVAVTRDAGFAAVVRLAGGRAAVFHESTLSFAWSIPDPDPRRRIKERFEEVANIVIEACGALGIEAAMGEVPGEYCPGAYSVHGRGRQKLMGVGQRLTRNAAHLGGVIVVDRADLVNRILDPVYRHLGYEWDPTATGSLAAEAPVTASAAASALVSVLAVRFRLREAAVDEETIEHGRSLAPDHLPG